MVIALGKSIARTGASTAGLARTPVRDDGVALAFLLTAALWWLYFEVAERSSRDLVGAEGEQGPLARDAYTYLHIPIIAGSSSWRSATSL